MVAEALFKQNMNKDRVIADPPQKYEEVDKEIDYKIRRKEHHKKELDESQEEVTHLENQLKESQD